MAKKKSLDDRAYEKVQREFDAFIADIKTKSPTEIVEAAYEITYKQEILCMFECEGAFNDKQSVAILKTKNALELDLDSEVSLNALRQSIARTLRYMNSLRSSEQIISGGGTGYRFNTDGNQVSYRCDVKRVVTINFDRNKVRKELEKLDKKSDETSAQLDLCLVTSRVDYDPPFDVNSSFAEAFEGFMGAGA